MNLIHSYFYLVVLVCFGIVAISPTHSRWKPEYTKMPPEVQAWYRDAKTMPRFHASQKTRLDRLLCTRRCR
jgi:hypothetical protein